jgi:glyoxylase-like metal-dependent hydrolase (beta-lactamase superfamily II)
MDRITRMILFRTCAISSLIAFPGVLAAQSPEVAHDAGARMERVADGVYAIIHANATEQWPNGNTGVVVGNDGVLIFDATYLPSRAKADIALIRSVTDKPVKFVVISHLHRDHNGGTSAYRDAFPSVIVVSGPQTRETIAINRAATARVGAADGSPLRMTLASLESQLTAGKDAKGVALSAEARRATERDVLERRAELTDLASLRVIVPDVTVDRRMDVFLGGKHVVLQDQGRANSPDDVTAYLPDERVWFTGDVVVSTPLPFLGATWPVEWSSVLRKIETTPIAALVPGHGAVMHDASYVHAMRTLIDRVNGEVGNMLAKGMSLDDMKATIDGTPLRALWAGWLSHDADDDWRLSFPALIERAWHELRGLD